MRPPPALRLALLLVLAVAGVVIAAGAGLTACGQKGPLYLGPQKKSKVPQATPQSTPQQPATPPPPQQQPPASPSPTSTATAPS